MLFHDESWATRKEHHCSYTSISKLPHLALRQSEFFFFPYLFFSFFVIEYGQQNSEMKNTHQYFMDVG